LRAVVRGPWTSGKAPRMCALSRRRRRWPAGSITRLLRFEPSVGLRAAAAKVTTVRVGAGLRCFLDATGPKSRWSGPCRWPTYFRLAGSSDACRSMASTAGRFVGRPTSPNRGPGELSCVVVDPIENPSSARELPARTHSTSRNHDNAGRSPALQSSPRAFDHPGHSPAGHERPIDLDVVSRSRFSPAASGIISKHWRKVPL